MRRNYIDELNVLTKQSTRLLESLKKLRNITDVEDRNKRLMDTALEAGLNKLFHILRSRLQTSGVPKYPDL